MNIRLFTIPNLLTCLNLVCGVAAIICAVHREVEYASLLIGISLVADFLDGFMARLLKVSGPVGKELDSLADVISFGAFPGVVMVYLLAESKTEGTFAGEIPWFAWSGLIIAAFSALRLAKFNLDTRQTDCFLGLATPANTIFILSIWIVKDHYPDTMIATFASQIYTLFAIIPIVSYLLISEVKLIAFKFKDLSFANNKFRFILMALCLVLLAVFRVKALPFLVPLYILVSIVGYWGEKDE